MKLICWTGGVLLACVAGCQDQTPTLVCTELANPAVVVSVRDAQTGVPAARGATLYALWQDGPVAGQDSSTDAGRGDSLSMYIGSREGRYDLRVHKSGYLDWTADNVVVTAPANCPTQVTPVVLDAALVPQ